MPEATMYPNQEGFHRRLDAVQKILQQHGLTSTEVTPIAYMEKSPFMFNNYIYKVDLASPALPDSFPRKQSCTSLPPAGGVTTLVIRMSNPHAEGLNNANRVENDVASSHLIRESLQGSSMGTVVPEVYAWAPCKFPEVPDETGFGWTMIEYKPGVDLDRVFPALNMEDAKDALNQLAEILTAIQRAKIPSTVTKFGALTINDKYEIVGGQMPLLSGDPKDTYGELWIAKLRAKLGEAEESTLLNGWRDGNIRGRIDQFIASGGVRKMLQPVDTDQRVLNHGDLTLNNLLYDNEAKRITGLLDFDWAAISHPCDEFLSGLWDIGGGIHERVGKLQANVLAGDFSSQPDDLSEEDVRKWEIAKHWDAALTERRAIRPSSIAGPERIQALRDLEDLLAPFALTNTFMLSRKSDEAKASAKKETEEQILDWFNRWDSL